MAAIRHHIAFRSFRWAIIWVAVIVISISAGFGGFLASIAPKASDAGVLLSPINSKVPLTLFETGLYADPATLTVDPQHIAFAPQYPLWSDGAEKHRWISLPPGDAIDTSDPDVWDFPVGTRLWKEFSFDHQKVETRYMERLADGLWLFAAYAWSDDGKDARLAPDMGLKNAHSLAGGASHAIPGVYDCRACHLSGPVPVLGFSERQLGSKDMAGLFKNNPEAPALDVLGARGVFDSLDARHLTANLTDASTLEREALGYLHGNCGHCHNRYGPLAKLGFDLRGSATDPYSGPIETTLGQPLKFPPPGLVPGTIARIAPGHPDRSAIPQRMASRSPMLQMPPLGTALVDAEAVELINRWIAETEVVSVHAQHHVGEEE
ncbi:hypothetical protein [Roseovarius arcticus]|uniref:hypothetical protein n=1 Tax=Roseovarius arcticus TaxID=2547404 RepID=UPI0011105A5D|nr:hypothetical protein [Roseovarius arcticus]